MILGDGVTLKPESGTTFTAATLAERLEGMYAPAPPMLQAQWCCETDHILGSLRSVPLAIECRPPFEEVWFELSLLRMGHMGPRGAGIETCIRLVPLGLSHQFTTRTETGQQLAGAQAKRNHKRFVVN